MIGSEHFLGFKFYGKKEFIFFCILRYLCYFIKNRMLQDSNCDGVNYFYLI
jgi:hypothetical protein